MSERVLLVEDNRALAENVAEILRAENLSVCVHHDAKGAEAAAREDGFDLAIVDIRLAGADVGLELVTELRRLCVHSEVLLITGNATVDSAIGAIRRGVYAYLTKPFEPDHLVAMVKRALAQAALKREKYALSQRLAASEALYRSVFESVESCILGVDAAGSVRFFNRAAAERLQDAGSPLLGLDFSSLGAPEDQASARHHLAKALAGSAVRDYECDVERGGVKRRIRWTLTPMGISALQSGQTSLSELPVVLAAGIDITERVELERKTAAAEAMAAMGTLTTALAHEIRNPLNAAKLQLELLLRRTRKLSDDAQRELVRGPAEIVRAEINRLGSLLDEFLDLARPRQIERKRLSVRTIFDEVETLQGPVFARQRVRFVTDVEPADLSVRGDHDKLKQVLLNLVMNAVEALHDTKDACVELRASHADGKVSLSVSDNGPGVPAELLGSAFTPFVTSKPLGTGLGLAVVQKIARQHGGVAELVARPRGVTARIDIPD